MKFNFFSFLFVFLITELAFSQIFFQDKALELGIDLIGNSSSILGGVSFYDFDNDGWDDLTFVDKESYHVKFYKNFSGQFIEQLFSITITGHSKQILWVDYDNDGDNDLFVTKLNGANKLYKNNGSFEFIDVTGFAGFPTSDVLFTYGASFGDYDNDGFLDVFLSNHDFDYLIPNQLYHNNGDGTFTNVSIEAGISLLGHLSFCSVFFDYDNDGFQDIYISNDGFDNHNILYHNNGDGTFSDLSALSDANIKANAMSTTIDDYNNDGWLDIYITNTPEGNYLLKNDGDGTFTNVSTLTGTIFNSWSWGAVFLDADNDTNLDLYVSGMFDGTSSLPSAFYENQGDNTFLIPESIGLDNDTRASFSNAIGDLNNDGLQDIVVVNDIDNNFLWGNTSSNSNNWLKIRLQGVTSNRDGIGSKIEIFANGKSQYRYTLCGEGYLGQNSNTELVGVGSATNIDYVKVTWLSGAVDILNNVTPNQTLAIIENSTLGIEESEVNNFIVYPNPSNGIVHIKSIYNKDFSLDIIDAIGRKMSSNNYINSLNNINIEKLPKGVYFFRFTIEDVELTKKVVIY